MEGVFQKVGSPGSQCALWDVETVVCSLDKTWLEVIVCQL
jgi:hypothetical protein